MSETSDTSPLDALVAADVATVEAAMKARGIDRADVVSVVFGSRDGTKDGTFEIKLGTGQVHICPYAAQPDVSDELTVAELKALLKDAGLSTTGNKDDLLARWEAAKVDNGEENP